MDRLIGDMHIEDARYIERLQELGIPKTTKWGFVCIERMSMCKKPKRIYTNGL